MSNWMTAKLAALIASGLLLACGGTANEELPSAEAVTSTEDAFDENEALPPEDEELGVSESALKRGGCTVRALPPRTRTSIILVNESYAHARSDAICAYGSVRFRLYLQKWTGSYWKTMVMKRHDVSNQYYESYYHYGDGRSQETYRFGTGGKPECYRTKLMLLDAYGSPTNQVEYSSHVCVTW